MQHKLEWRAVQDCYMVAASAGALLQKQLSSNIEI